jgi:hypothetical protein
MPAAISENATVTMPFSDFRKLERELESTKASKTKQAVVVNESERNEALIKALDPARAIIQFAVANLNPESVRGWPYEALRGYADALDAVNAAQDPETTTFAMTLRDFARSAEEIDRFRVERAKAALDVVRGELADAADSDESTDVVS